jgi:hypothetical protein
VFCVGDQDGKSVGRLAITIDAARALLFLVSDEASSSLVSV